MKAIKYSIFLGLCILCVTSCVQKKYKRIVVVKLKTNPIEQKIETVGIRGNGKPLSWRKDLILNPIVQDSLYNCVFTIETGYKFIEVKFSINEKLELENKDNRRIYFSDKSDTTFYNAVFNKSE